jgi:ADP-ribosyl-[dinitrogen reductase] hydrolase
VNEHCGACSTEDRLAGILLGTAVGESLGLPAEGLSPQRRRRLLPGPWRQRLFFGRGLLSDDTEHTILVAQSLLAQPDGPIAFQRQLGKHLRWWFASLPPGIGKATARACMKLWLGFPASRSGVFSAGNGPAMRSAILGGYFHDQSERIDGFVRQSTRLTHTDSKAETGARAIALLAAWAVNHSPQDRPTNSIFEQLNRIAAGDAEWQAIIAQMQTAHARQSSVVDFAIGLGLERGVTGYIYHTVPVAAYAWLRHYGDFRATLEAALDCGGDADTVGAIAGALAGATVGGNGIPEDWLRGIADWPRSVGLLRRIASAMADQRRSGLRRGPVGYCWPAVLPRNLFLLVVVLYHGFRRLAPPY